MRVEGGPTVTRRARGVRASIRLVVLMVLAAAAAIACALSPHVVRDGLLTWRENPWADQEIGSGRQPCITVGYSRGTLLRDPEYGTVFRRDSISGNSLVWPPGFSAREASNGELDILDEDGDVFVRTGQRVELDVGVEFSVETYEGPVIVTACHVVVLADLEGSRSELTRPIGYRVGGRVAEWQTRRP
jgi:hypothetical protein